MNEVLGNHIVGKFDEEMKVIFEKVLLMGGALDERLKLSKNSVLDGDDIAATKLLSSDVEINNMDLDIAEKCANVFMKRCPNSTDLRFLIGVTHIIRDMERIGDLAQEIGHYSQSLLEEQQINKNRDVMRHIIKLSKSMFADAQKAFSTFDADLAFQVIKQDGAVNKELDDINRLLITHMMEDSRTIRSSLLIFNAAQSYERIGDHVKNICEAVIYIVKGEDIRYRNIDGLEAILED